MAGDNLENGKGEEAPSKRINLACLKCRSKRSRCSGTKPTCEACLKAGLLCLWPEGRRPKRRRVEIEAADRLMVQEAQQRASETSELPSPPSAGIVFARPADEASNGSADYASSRSALRSPTLPTPSLPELFSNSYGDPAILEPFQWQSHVSEDSASPSSLFPAFTNAQQQSTFLKALESQPFVVEPDQENPDNLNLYYYRFSGSTAFHPGVNRINLRLQSKKSANGAGCSAPTMADTDTGRASAPQSVPFDDTGMPLAHVYEPLMDLFFKHASAIFPSVSRMRMRERLATGTMSAFMMNAICAIGARFQPGLANPTSACAPFMTRAQELLIPLLHLPTHDVVTGLLLLAWAAYGQNSESGLWQFSGMAIRMAIDLGLHELQEVYESAAHVKRTRLLLWSLFITDRVVSFSTGRPVSLLEESIEIPLPDDADFYPDPAAYEATSEPVQPVPFVMLTKLMVHVGRISNVLNGRRGQKRTLMVETEPPQEQLKNLQSDLIELYTTLPPSLRWSVDAFKLHEQRGHGGIFLALHCWANGILTLIYHPQLTNSNSGIETPVRAGLQRSVKLSLASARLTTECLVYADLCSSHAYIAAPIIVQPLFVAALAFVHELKTSQLFPQASGAMSASGTSTDAFLASIDRQSLTTLNKALGRLEHYWPGAAFAINILQQRQAGLGYNQIDSGLKVKQACISLPDRGLLRRFQTNNPLVVPPTETSLQASKEADSPNMLPPEDLFAEYTAFDMSMTPVTSFDIEAMLSQGFLS